MARNSSGVEPALLQTPLQSRGEPGARGQALICAKQEASRRIERQYVREYLVEFWVNLEQRVRTRVESYGFRQPELRARRRLHAGSLVVCSQAWQPKQSFGVVQCRLRRFHRVAAQEVVDILAACRLGVTPCGTLDRREAQSSQSRVARIHPDLRIDQHIQRGGTQRSCDLSR